MAWSDGSAGASRLDALLAFADHVLKNKRMPKDDRLLKAAVELLRNVPEGKTRISTSGDINPDGTGRIMLCVTMEH